MTDLVRPTGIPVPSSGYATAAPDVTALQGAWRGVAPAELDRCRELLAGRRWVVLTGAGMSTDSGIPDYRGPNSPKASPMMYGDFCASVENRRRYWARSFLGWSRMGLAVPNGGHRALARLGSVGVGPGSGLAGVITQNVDGLHARAGSRPVVDLHGRIADVVCLDCRDLTSRAEAQRRLAELNPGYRVPTGAGSSPDPQAEVQLRPDGDAVVEDWQDFVLADCRSCGGRLKPDVVFFGEAVPRDRVATAYAMVEDADLLLVAGSSLTVMSGLRFVRHNARAGKDVIIVNRGHTRGDEFATLKIDGGCTELLTALELSWRT